MRISDKWLGFLSLTMVVLLVGCRANVQKPSEVKGSNIKISANSPSNAKAEALIAPYREKLNGQMDEVIGKSAQDLTKGHGESSLGNCIADLTLSAAQILENKKLDMAAVTIGGLRINIPKGPIKVRDIYELMPFENELAIVTLSGPDTYKLFLYMAENKNLALAGAKVVFENKVPVTITIGDSVFNQNRSYTIALTDYLANGGDKMDVMLRSTSRKMTGKKFRDVIIDYIKDLTSNKLNLVGAVDGRAVFNDK